MGLLQNLPAGMNAYAGYVDDGGDGITFPAVAAAHPTSLSSLHLCSRCRCHVWRDVENGALGNWVGYDFGYCAVSNVNANIAAFGRPKKLWTAHYDPKYGAHMLLACSAGLDW